jgi:hypothetical protein
MIWVTALGTVPSFARISDEWRAITGDSYVVHMKEMTCTRTRKPGEPLNFDLLTRDAVERDENPIRKASILSRVEPLYAA